jgi:hypothetical protein
MPQECEVRRIFVDLAKSTADKSCRIPRFSERRAALRVHALKGNRAHTCEFRSILRDVRKLWDWMVEGSGFEPPVPRGLLWAKFSASLAHYSARQKASVPERICLPGIRLCSGCLRFASFARLKANARRCGTLERLQVQIRAIVWRRSAEFLPSSSPPHHVAAATAMKNSVDNSRISARVGRCARPTASSEDFGV